MNAGILAGGACAVLALGAVACGSQQDESKARNEPAARYELAYTKALNFPNQAVWVAQSDGTSARRLAAGRTPSLSPNGKWVVYRGNCDKDITADCRDLFVISTSGGHPRLLVSGAGEADLTPQPEWSPDSTRIVAVKGQELLSIHVGTGEVVVLDRGRFNGWSFSPSDEAVVYSRGREYDLLAGQPDLFVVDSSGGTPRRLTGDGRSAFPVWGPRLIAFARFSRLGGCPSFEIWAISPSGGQPRRVTRQKEARPLGPKPVEWSASGDRLLGAFLVEAAFPPIAIDPRTGAQRPIGQYGDDDAFAFDLSRDGRWVLVQAGPGASTKQRIERVAYSSGRKIVLARNASEPSWNR